MKGRDKYKMHLAMNNNLVLQPHLPDTKKWTKKNFYKMLKDYQSIVVKPNNGKQGKNIYFIEKGQSIYTLSINKETKEFKRRYQVYSYLTEAIGDKEFIIQREINLAKIDNRRFDFRIIVQRLSLKSPWEVTGILARKGGSGYKVTNRRHHGTALALEEALNKLGIPEHLKKRLVNNIKELSLLAAETLGQSYPKQTIFGVDIGMDHKGNLYIFELNLWPLLGGFRSLEDRTQIKRIMAYKKAAEN
ncbi:YheC/YheD family protein [Salipaludibacillus aurantiacus]